MNKNENENEALNHFLQTQLLEQDEYFGRMSDPTSASRIQGPCGDDMEFYLVIKDDVLEEVKYFTETGCFNTIIAGRSVARRVIGKNIYEALSVNPAIIIKEEKELATEGQHCAILATTTFYRAVAFYLLDKSREDLSGRISEIQWI
ncbi:MAG: iron-sulfur cluster assembly scaffold protein [Oligoflexia bacterium]|nr:iron-sulfur cluster assembly scaffold protein [Oligoflexia bacterium]